MASMQPLAPRVAGAGPAPLQALLHDVITALIAVLDAIDGDMDEREEDDPAGDSLDDGEGCEGDASGIVLPYGIDQREVLPSPYLSRPLAEAFHVRGDEADDLVLLGSAAGQNWRGPPR